MMDRVGRGQFFGNVTTKRIGLNRSEIWNQATTSLTEPSCGQAQIQNSTGLMLGNCIPGDAGVCHALPGKSVPASILHAALFC